jgi:GTP 3',8-cyclase
MSEHMTFLPKADLLSLEELDRLCSAFVTRGVSKLRLTGGEPLVRRGIMTLFRSLSRHCNPARCRSSRSRPMARSSKSTRPNSRTAA